MNYTMAGFGFLYKRSDIRQGAPKASKDAVVLSVNIVPQTFRPVILKKARTSSLGSKYQTALLLLELWSCFHQKMCTDSANLWCFS